ncbi:hypothetical protein NP493_414g01009 [Ridgeia piscesae]|uniref:EGF-like domain-containing protein n=1 Tax=Ridgeia piscesae TaxID=27915 RepID=A0AAD9L0Y3_RIDPI|nr:hypothetical protein NP493_414g01009 [Ridgeia piscesae]
MPAEILYRTDNCSSKAMLRRLQSEFQAKLQVIIRMQSACAFNPGDCIVEDVVASCDNARPARRRRSRRHRYQARTQRHTQPRSRRTRTRTSTRTRRYVPTRQQRYLRQQAQLARRRRMGRHSRRGQFVMPVQLYLATRVPETGGGWPDDLTFDHVVAVCDIGYQFNKNILLCVACGAGTYYDLELEVCALCPLGDYQNEEGQFSCKRCPTGTASVERGATNVTQCVEIDECESNPCVNYGQCQDSHSSYTCAHCEVKVYDCYVHSCQNGGQCEPEGELNYTFDGQWSSWSEWTPCTKSCKGGVTMRNRTCDSPSPSNGGRPCEDAAVEEKVCNLHPCPACRRLRRPYRGSMECVNDTTGDLITCTVQCPAGYDFAGQTFKNAAGDEDRLKREISKQATALTSQLSCIRDGTCKLEPPTVKGCHPRKKRDAPADKYGGLTYVEFEVSITRDSDSSRTTDSSQKEMTQELSRLGDDLSNRSARNDLYVVVDGRKVVIDPDNTTTSNTLECPDGSEASLYGEYCVECSPGSFYNVSAHACIRCDVGSYQPAPAQTECLTCPDGKMTYGRGAVFEMECYDSSNSPPAIPMDYVGDASSGESQCTLSSS